MSDLVHRLREPAGEPEGALILNHGRGADENDLYGLLDILDPERRLLGVTTGAPLTGIPPVTGSGTATVPNAAFYANTTFGRDTYLVVERARITPGDGKYDAGLAALVNPASATSLTNFTAGLSGSPRRVKEKFGFLAPSQTAPIYAYATL